jgi:hypothetical protein
LGFGALAGLALLREKSVVEGRLKRAGHCLANSEAGTQFVLGRTKHLGVVFAQLLADLSHRPTGKIGRVAIAAEMTEHDTLDFPREQLR